MSVGLFACVFLFVFGVLPRTRTRLGDRSFAVAGPQIRNSLPADLRLVDMLALGDS